LFHAQLPKYSRGPNIAPVPLPPPLSAPLGKPSAANPQVGQSAVVANSPRQASTPKKIKGKNKQNQIREEDIHETQHCLGIVLGSHAIGEPDGVCGG
jgi:hypothetical protein